jgi:chromosome segregation ATPase
VCRLLEFEGSVKRLSDELTAERGKREDAEGRLAIAESELAILTRNADEARSLKEKVTATDHQLDELKEKTYALEEKLKEEEQAKSRAESELKAEKELRAREKAEVDARNVKLRSKFEELIKDKSALKAALEEEREKAGKTAEELSNLQQEVRKFKVSSQARTLLL